MKADTCRITIWCAYCRWDNQCSRLYQSERIKKGQYHMTNQEKWDYNKMQKRYVKEYINGTAESF